jgi:hypothetical protein
VIHRSFDALDVLLRCRRYRRASGLALVYACRFGREDIVVQLLHFCGGKYYFLSIFTISAISHTHCRWQYSSFDYNNNIGAHPGPINTTLKPPLKSNLKLTLEEQQLRPDLPPVPLDAIDDDIKHPSYPSCTLITPAAEDEIDLLPGVDRTQNGPLHWAAHGGHSRIVELLINKGADPFLRNKEGKLPLDLAREAGYHGICSYLQKKTKGGLPLAKIYEVKRLGNTLHTTTMQQRVSGMIVSSSEEEDDDDDNDNEEEQEDEEKKIKTKEELEKEEDERRLQFLLHPLCAECSQTNWATRKTLLNKDTFGTKDRTKKLCPGYDPSTHDSLVCRYCGHSRGRHHNDPLVIANIKLKKKREREEYLENQKMKRKAELRAAVVEVV